MPELDFSNKLTNALREARNATRFLLAIASTSRQWKGIDAKAIVGYDRVTEVVMMGPDTPGVAHQFMKAIYKLQTALGAPIEWDPGTDEFRALKRLYAATFELAAVAQINPEEGFDEQELLELPESVVEIQQVTASRVRRRGETRTGLNTVRATRLANDPASGSNRTAPLPVQEYPEDRRPGRRVMCPEHITMERQCMDTIQILFPAEPV